MCIFDWIFRAMKRARETPDTWNPPTRAEMPPLSPTEMTLLSPAQPPVQAGMPEMPPLCMPPAHAESHGGYLAERHPLPQDSEIRFTDEDHRYYVQWKPGHWSTDGSKSATGFIKEFFDSFDADAIIDRMHARFERTEKCDKKYKAEDSTPTEPKMKTKEQIKAMWEENRINSSMMGTLFHKMVEDFLNKKKIPDDEKTTAFYQWLDWYSEKGPKWADSVYRTELMVKTDLQTLLCGSIDMIRVAGVHEPKDGSEPTLLLEIYDWKNSKAIKDFSRERGRGPCSGLPNANFYHYALQASLYQWIVETYCQKGWVWQGKMYNRVKVVGRFIVVCHEANARKRRRKKFDIDLTGLDWGEAKHREVPEYGKAVVNVMPDYTKIISRMAAQRAEELGHKPSFPVHQDPSELQFLD